MVEKNCPSLRETDRQRIKALSRFDRIVQEDRPSLILNGSCVSIAVRLQQLRASVSSCPFQKQHAVFQTGGTASAGPKERPPFGPK